MPRLKRQQQLFWLQLWCLEWHQQIGTLRQRTILRMLFHREEWFMPAHQWQTVIQLTQLTVQGEQDGKVHGEMIQNGYMLI